MLETEAQDWPFELDSLLPFPLCLPAPWPGTHEDYKCAFHVLALLGRAALRHQTGCLEKGISSASWTFHKIKNSSMLPLQAEGRAGDGCVPRPSVAGKASHITAQAAQTTDPGAVGTLPSPTGCRLPARRGVSTAGGGPTSSAPNTLTISNMVPSFRSHIKSASFLLRQQDLPTKQAAGTHVFITRRLALKCTTVNH